MLVFNNTAFVDPLDASVEMACNFTADEQVVLTHAISSLTYVYIQILQYITLRDFTADKQVVLTRAISSLTYIYIQMLQYITLRAFTADEQVVLTRAISRACITLHSMA